MNTTENRTFGPLETAMKHNKLLPKKKRKRPVRTGLSNNLGKVPPLGRS